MPLNLIILIISEQEYKLLLQPSYVQVISLAPCPQTFSVLYLPLMSETKFHTHKKVQANFAVLFVLIFTFLESRRDDKMFWTEYQQALPELNFSLISSQTKFRFATVFSKCSKCTAFFMSWFYSAFWWISTYIHSFLLFTSRQTSALKSITAASVFFVVLIFL
jgi:hypothetical protein